jgi:hypothetical protein
MFSIPLEHTSQNDEPGIASRIEHLTQSIPLKSSESDVRSDGGLDVR